MKKTQTLTFYNFMEYFSDEKAVIEFFEMHLWSNVPECPACHSLDTSPRPWRNGHRCKKCRKDFTIRTGTIFTNPRVPMRKWLYAMYLTLTMQEGISALQLSKELAISPIYAYFLLQRLRESCTGSRKHLFKKR